MGGLVGCDVPAGHLVWWNQEALTGLDYPDDLGIRKPGFGSCFCPIAVLPSGKSIFPEVFF